MPAAHRFHAALRPGRRWLSIYAGPPAPAHLPAAWRAGTRRDHRPDSSARRCTSRSGRISGRPRSPPGRGRVPCAPHRCRLRPRRGRPGSPGCHAPRRTGGPARCLPTHCPSHAHARRSRTRRNAAAHARPAPRRSPASDACRGARGPPPARNPGPRPATPPEKRESSKESSSRWAPRLPRLQAPQRPSQRRTRPRHARDRRCRPRATLCPGIRSLLPPMRNRNRSTSAPAWRHATGARWRRSSLARGFHRPQT